MKQSVAILVALFILNTECLDLPVTVPGAGGGLPVTVPSVPGLPDLSSLDLSGIPSIADIIPQDLLDLLTGIYAILCKVVVGKNSAYWLSHKDILPSCVNCPAVNGKGNTIKCPNCIPTCYNPKGLGVCSQDCNKACICNSGFYSFGQKCIQWAECQSNTKECTQDSDCDDSDSCHATLDPNGDTIKLCTPRNQIPGTAGPLGGGGLPGGVTLPALPVSLPATPTLPVGKKVSIDINGGKSQKKFGPAESRAQKCGRRRQKGTTQEKSMSSMDLRRERLDYILELFKQNPSLADTSYSRLPALIEKRQHLWESITEKVNEKFAMKLEEITVEQVKKNMLYLKRKEEISNENNKDVVIPDSFKYDSIKTPGHHGLSNENVKQTFKNEIRDSTPDDSENEYPYSVSKTSLTPEPQATLADILNNGTQHNTVASKSQGKKNRILAKERAVFISEQAEYYMKRLCLDTTARSMAVNIERNNMWMKIVEKTNEKYKNKLAPIGLEQAKKQYANYKMRARPKSEAVFNSCFDETESPKSTRRTIRYQTNSPFLKIEDFRIISPDNDPMGDISIRPKTEHLEKQLLLKLKEKEAQIQSLKKKVDEQAKDYANRVNIMMEMVKTAVNKSAQEEIAKVFY